MAKFVFLLCIALFVVVSSVSCQQETVQGTTETPSFFQRGLNKVQSVYSGAKNKLSSLLPNKDQAERERQLEEEARRQLEEAQRINCQRVDAVTDYDVSECKNLGADLELQSYEAVQGIIACFKEQYALARQEWAEVQNVAKNLNNQLEVYRQEAHECADKIDSGLLSYLKSTLCQPIAPVKALWASVKTVPQYAVRSASGVKFFTLLGPKLAACSAVQSAKTFYDAVSSIAERTDACINNKVQELQEAKRLSEDYQRQLQNRQQNGGASCPGCQDKVLANNVLNILRAK